MKVSEFIQEFKNKKIQNTKLAPTAIEDFIKEKLLITTYIPFNDKKQIAEMVVHTNMTEENGIKKIDSAGQFIGFVVAMLIYHTNLEIDAENPIEDYDLICEAGLLEPIVAQFQKDYAECEVALKMVVADALVDNNLNAVVARFLDGILDKLDGVGDVFSNIVSDFDVNSLFGNFQEEDLTKLKGFLDKYNK